MTDNLSLKVNPSGGVAVVKLVPVDPWSWFDWLPTFFGFYFMNIWMDWPASKTIPLISRVSSSFQASMITSTRVERSITYLGHESIACYLITHPHMMYTIVVLMVMMSKSINPPLSISIIYRYRFDVFLSSPPCRLSSNVKWSEGSLVLIAMHCWTRLKDNPSTCLANYLLLLIGLIDRLDNLYRSHHRLTRSPLIDILSINIRPHISKGVRERENFILGQAEYSLFNLLRISKKLWNYTPLVFSFLPSWAWAMD